MASILPHDDEIVGTCLAGDEEAATARALALSTTDQRHTIYPSSKLALSKWVRRVSPLPEWAGAGIPLNAVAPGVVRTPMTRDALSNPRARRSIEKQVPMPLSGPVTPETVAALIRWLSSEENTATTGQIIFIDGGADPVLRGDSII
jgi:NAD(P)-dependent dehydrogenase (short-subunit alcohol dehydrogenase family)